MLAESAGSYTLTAAAAAILRGAAPVAILRL